MWYYIFAFAFSLIGIYFANNSYKSKGLFFLFSVISLIPPVVIAGFRDHTIGSDTDFYILPIFTQATRYFLRFDEFVEANPNTDYLYLLYTWLVTRIIKESYFFLCMNHIMILFPMYMAAFKFRRYLSPVLFFLIYFLVFYQDSLSIVRQSMAISFSTLAFAYFLSKKYKIYFVLMVLAFGFHSTVILTFLYPVLLWYLKKYPLDRYKGKYIIFILIGVLIIINLNFLLMFLINSGVLNIKYLIYTSESDTFKGGLGVTNFGVKFVVIFFIYKFRTLHKESLFVDFAFVLAILDLMLCLCALLMEPLDRFSLYPRLMSCITLPYLFRICQKEHQTTLLFLKNILFLLFMAYWYYVYMLGDYDSTSDYKMVISLI